MKSGFEGLVEMLNELDKEYQLNERGLLGLICYGVAEAVKEYGNTEKPLETCLDEVFEGCDFSDYDVRKRTRKEFEEINV